MKICEQAHLDVGTLISIIELLLTGIQSVHHLVLTKQTNVFHQIITTD